MIALLILVLLYATHLLGVLPFCPFCFLKLRLGRIVAVRYFRWLEKKLEEMAPDSPETEEYKRLTRINLMQDKERIFRRLGIK